MIKQVLFAATNDELLLLIGVFVLLLAVNIWRLQKQKRISPHAGLYSAFLAVVIGIFVLFPSLIAMKLWVLGKCEPVVSESFHVFTAHLNDLCSVERKEGLAECPQDKEQLRAFRPELFAQMEQCTFVRYGFDQRAQQYYPNNMNWEVFYATPFSEGRRDVPMPEYFKR